MELDEAGRRFLGGETHNAEVLVTLGRGSDPNGRDFYMLFNCLRDSHILFWTPEILKRIIKEEKWRKWQWIGRQFEAATLTDYLVKLPPKGLGAKLEDVEKLIASDSEALALFREHTTGKPGGDRQSEKAKSNTDIVSNGQEPAKPKHGNSLAYTLERLKNEKPELFAKVVAKEMTANQAAKAAGWRKEQSPLQKLRSAWKAANNKEREIFSAEILDL